MPGLPCYKSPMDSTTWTNAPGLDARDVIAEMRRLAEEIRARDPVAVALEHRPAERIPWEEAGVPVVRAETAFLGLAGLKVEVNPDVPPGEVWIRKSDGTVDKIVNVAVPV